MRPTTRSIRPLALGCLLVPCPGDDPVRLGHAPPPGLELGIELELAVDVECTEVTILAEGEELPPDDMPPGFTERELSTSIELGASFVDHGFEYIEAEGSLARFLRRVEGLSFGGVGFGGLGPLEDGSLLRYSREGDGYAVRLVSDPDDEGEEVALLELLHHDLVASFLLPDEEVELGETWTVDLDLAQATWMLAPGARIGGLESLAEFLELGPVERALISELPASLERGLDQAEMRVGLSELEGEGGEMTAVLDLAGELVIVADLSDTFRAVAEGAVDSGQEVGDLEASLRLEVEWTGELRQRVEDGHLESLDLDADWTAEVESSGEVIEGGYPIPVEALFVWEGTQEARIRTEAGA